MRRPRRRHPDPQRAAVDEDGRHGPAPDIEARLDHDTRRLSSGICAQIELGVRDEQDLLEEITEVFVLFRGDGRELRGTTPVLGLEPFRCQLALHAIDVRVGHVHLVDRDDDRHLGRACMRDRFLRLRHDAVVGRDDEHGDVRHLRAAGPHRGESLVARRVEERDPPSVDLGLVRADVLRDPPASVSTTDVSRMASSRVVFPWSTCPMIVTTGGRGARSSSSSSNSVGSSLLGGVLDRDLPPELRSDDLDFLVRERLRGRAHLPERHEDLDELRHRNAERVRGLDGGARLDRHRPRRGGGAGAWRGWEGAPNDHAPAAPGCALRRLDDDAPLSSAGSSSPGRIGRFGLFRPSAISV